MSGTSGLVPYLGYTAMSVAKAMVNSFIECAALEMAYHNIRINGVAAGITEKNFDYAMGEDVDKKGTEKTLHFSKENIPYKMHPLVIEELDTSADPKVIEGRDVANVVCWLCSDEAKFITGEITNVDSGISLTSSNYNAYEKEFLKTDHAMPRRFE